ncbi:FAD-binding oxidoreductase [Alicyclobacillus cycloheptanicus]|uniref:FAD/FMN-containing dehydrogenase n=1 Tax=Alicyclobacillus cycloheptanicus TaxID=1457 RepID=A0ABT9XMJ5_9BACL|nr:FAD-binding oxidoreductase [Alicyclobacillus cycloheptanicus]MDQ0191541.1 FAD/FMN-containing dehydrogenase [Alicyclobacillus cycloheptanicus]WDM03068.1 FAD-binding oxidoreductase [Alicyclobacillus cycloheptanicus]
MSKEILAEGVCDLGNREVSHLRDAIHGSVILPGEPAYEHTRKVWNALFDRRPAVIVVCRGVSDVVETVKFASRYGLPVSVRGGGHHIAGHGTCDNGVMIDTSEMRAVSVNPVRRIATVQCGATAGEVIRETQRFGLAVPTGDVSKVGIAGLTLGGGMGYLRRKYGLTCDNLIGADIVLADGSFVHVSADENPELFWAIRGGGGNFGVVTSFEFQLHPVGPMVMGIQVTYSGDDMAVVLRGCRDYLATGTVDVSFNIAMVAIPPLPGVPPHLVGQRVVTLNGMHAGKDLEQAALDIEPLRRLATPLMDMSGPVDYTGLHTMHDDRIPEGVPAYGKSLYVGDLDDEMINVIKNAVRNGGPMSMAMIWPLGGEMANVPADRSAFGDRGASSVVMMESLWQDPSEEEPAINWVTSFYDALRPYAYNDGTYLNMAGLEEDVEAIIRASYGRNYERLAIIKRQYDPTNVFRFNLNIAPVDERIN